MECGVLSAFFGMLAFGAVICLHFPRCCFPNWAHPMQLMRLVIQAVIAVAIILGCPHSAKKKVLGLTGMLFALGATLSGGASVEIKNRVAHAARPSASTGSCSTCC